jgi:DNA-binding winged helix-turn-helix (wHTH) protein
MEVSPLNANGDCAENKELALLILYEGEEPGECWMLNQNQIILGRDPDCDIVLADRQVSRQHATITRRTDGEYIIQDCQSKNGTCVNGIPLEGEHTLRDGDEIQVALRFRLTFVAPGATTPLFFDEYRQASPLMIDKESRRVWVKGQELDPPLSLAQYRLLELLYENAGRVCSRDAIIEVVWPEAVEQGISEQAIDALIRRLRERLAEIDTENQYIVTVRGHGFRLESPSG